MVYDAFFQCEWIFFLFPFAFSFGMCVQLIYSFLPFVCRCGGDDRICATLHINQIKNPLKWLARCMADFVQFPSAKKKESTTKNSVRNKRASFHEGVAIKKNQFISEKSRFLDFYATFTIVYYFIPNDEIIHFQFNHNKFQLKYIILLNMLIVSVFTSNTA